MLGCGAASETASNRKQTLASHHRMLAELEKIRERTPWENEFLGQGELPEAEARLAALSPDEPPVIEIELHRVIGVNQLRLGNLDDAVEHLTLAADLAKKQRIGREGFDQSLLLLALAHLRRGETDNCIACQTGESCVFPIRKGGLHKRPTGSLDAVRVLNELLKRNPEDLAAPGC